MPNSRESTKLKNLSRTDKMLSTQYRLRLEFICKKIANKEDVKLEDMIWAEKLSKVIQLPRWLRKARRHAAQDIEEGMDDFMNKMGLGILTHQLSLDSLVQTKLLIGLSKTNLMIGDNVTEFEDHSETYEKMNKEFEEEGLASVSKSLLRKIDDWRQRDQ